MGDGGGGGRPEVWVEVFEAVLVEVALVDRAQGLEKVVGGGVIAAVCDIDTTNEGYNLRSGPRTRRGKG